MRLQVAVLSRFQQRIMGRAKKYGFVSVERYRGTIAGGVQLSGGGREVNAALKLVEMGLLRILHEKSHVRYRNGYGVRVITVTLVPTPEQTLSRPSGQGTTSDLQDPTSLPDPKR
jgi:hypothetical protein